MLFYMIGAKSSVKEAFIPNYAIEFINLYTSQLPNQQKE